MTTDTDKSLDLNKTAGDEAAEIRRERKAQVMVTCSLPAGIVLNNHLDKDGNATGAANIGPGTPIEVKGSTPVDKDFFDAWATYNGSFVERGVVSAVPIEEIRRNEAEERELSEKQDGEALGSESSERPEQDLE